jgi:hypothetical protein
MGPKYTEKIQIVPVWAPQVSTVADSETLHVNMKNAHWVTFLVQFGAIATDTTDTGSIKLYSTTASNTTSNAIAQTFDYRLSSAAGTDAWGSITAGTAASGFAVSSAYDNMALLIDVDPSEILTLDSDAEFVHLLIECSEMTGVYISASALIEPRYPQNANLTSS